MAALSFLGKQGHHGSLSGLLSVAGRSSKAGCREQASCIALFVSSLLCPFLGVLQLLPVTCAISAAASWWGIVCLNSKHLTSWWEGVQRRVLHKLLLLPMQGGEIGQLVAVFWLRKVMILISANFSRKCGAYSSQQPGRGRWVWKAELRGDSNSNKDWCVLAVVKHAVGGAGGMEKAKHRNIWSLNNSQKNGQHAKDFSSTRQLYHTCRWWYPKVN